MIFPKIFEDVADFEESKNIGTENENMPAQISAFYT